MSTTAVELVLKNIEFLPCFEAMDKEKNIQLYRFLEKLVYGEVSDEILIKNKTKLKNSPSISHFLAELATELSASNTGNTTTHKVAATNAVKPARTRKSKALRQNVTESKLEDYVISMQQGSTEKLSQLKKKIILKSFAKGTIVFNQTGDIVHIKGNS